MRVLLDTSVIVEIDRLNKDVLALLKELTSKNVELVVSTVTISEILTGSYLSKRAKKAVLEAKKILSQFLWIDLDGEVAEKTGKLLAYLIIEGKMVEYQDVVIAATFFASHSDYLITLNKSHFLVFPKLKGKVFTPVEFRKICKNVE